MKRVVYLYSVLLVVMLLAPHAAHGQQLVIESIVPEETIFVESGQSEFIEYTLTVTAEGSPVDGAGLIIENPFLSEDDFDCCTDENGEIVYGVEVSGNEPDGLYFLSFVAFYSSESAAKSSVGFDNSEPVERAIRIGPAALAFESVVPGDDQVVEPGGSIEYTLTVIDENTNEAVEGAGIIVYDPFVSGEFDIFETDANGVITYTMEVPPSAQSGPYSIYFEPFHEYYEEGEFLERTFEVGAKLVIASATPTQTQFLRPGESIEYMLTITFDGVPVEGAYIEVDDELLDTVVEVHQTNAAGQIPYQTTVPETAAEGLYNLTFVAFADDFAPSDPVVRSIEVDRPALFIASALPEALQVLAPGQTVDYRLIVEDAANNRIGGVSLRVDDALRQDVVEVGETDEAGVIMYQATVPETLPDGVYTLSFVAFGPGYEDSPPVQRQVEVRRTALHIAAITPEAPQTLAPGRDFRYSIRVTNGPTGPPVEGVTVEVDDPLLGSVVVTAPTNAQGVTNYQAMAPGDAVSGSYTLSFVAKDPAYTDSEAVTRVINVPATALRISSVLPEATQNVNPGGSVVYTVTVTDPAGSPFQGATVEVDDPFLGTLVEVSPTDANGVITYTANVPGTASEGTFTLSFIASAEGFDDSFAVERQIAVGRTALVLSSITPEATQTIPAGGSVVYTITVTDVSNSPVQGATVEVDDPLLGSVAVTPPTNAQGVTSYTSTAPGDAVPGSYSLSFVARDPAYDPSEAVMRQIDVSANILTVTPQAIDFGEVAQASTAQESITIENTGSADLTITAASLSDGTVGFSLQGVSLPLVLAPQASATWTVAFTPTSIGVREDQLGITSDGGSAVVSLRGEGVSAARIPPEVNPAELTFAATGVGAASGEQTVTVDNADAGAITLNFALEGPDADAFEVVSGGAAVTLGPSDPPHAVVLRYAPTCTGPQTATLRVTWDEAPDRTVVLNGTGLAPTLSAPQPASVPMAGEDVQLRMPVPGFAFTQAQLFYRSVGEASFSQVALQQQDDLLVGTIPAASVQGAGVEYYVRIASACAVATFPQGAPNPASPAFLAVGVANLSRAVAPRQYRMLTVPYVLGDARIDAVFVDDFGPYDPAVWRMAAWNTNGAQPDNGAYVEYPALNRVPGVGRAFWLITSEAASFDIDDGTPVDPRQPFELTLPAGWHQIGSPYPVAMAWSAVQVSAPMQGPHGYNGQEYQLNVSQLEPWQGYFVYVLPPGPATVRFPSPSQATKQAASPAFAGADYVLRLIATAPGYDLHDTQNYVGFAEVGLGDRLNLLEPPPIGDHVRLSIREGDARYASHFAVPVEGGGRWDLEVSLSWAPRADVPVRVALLDEQPRPEGFEVYVFDRDEGRVLPLEAEGVEVTVSAAQPVRHLSLVLGTTAFAELHSEGISLVPTDFVLDGNYPNPFNPETVIRYSVARKEQVVLEVYDALGRLVRQLVAEEQPAASYEVVWDGRNDAGQLVASGIYVYRLRAGTFTKARTMLLLR